MARGAVVLIVIGLSIMVYPWLEDRAAIVRTDRYVQQLENGEWPRKVQAQQEYELEDVSEMLEVGLKEDIPAGDEDGDIIALIEIPSIDLKLPVFTGVSEYILNYGVGYVNGEREFDHNGNAALAAHRGYAHGKLFNRLDEVEKGDHIQVKTENKDYIYVVQRTFLVEPDHLEVLEPIEGESWITLITCDPIPNPTHRLIVQGEWVK
ncbi:class D sortase [Halobacillus sp. Cin3]|uniref:class D sortase n=1 Tax=Halobacillus sp. Cin3 TaxID=2928441 RepID=UPI00248E4AF1|nr:class D sortase [Halobacillus sp. Cin3]